MVPTGVFGYFDDPEINEMQKFDPALAKEQLVGTPYEGGQNWPEITLYMRGSEEVFNSDLMANDIVAQLQENLGMNVNIQVWPGETWRPELFKNEFQLFWIRWWYDYPDPNNGYGDMFYSQKASGKRQAWSNAEFDDLARPIGAHGNRLDVQHGQSSPRFGELELAQPCRVARVGGQLAERREVVVLAVGIRVRGAHRHVSFLPVSAAAGRMVCVSDSLMIDADATRWAPSERDGLPLLVMLHGYGADEHDLFGLVPYLPDGIAVASVAAPLTPPWPSPGRSWYPIEGLDGRHPDGVTGAARALLRWLDAATEDAPKVALLGFSQGAAVSLQAMRLDSARFSAIVALSGYAVPDALPDDDGLRTSRPKVFWGRGTHDDVIPAALIAPSS